MSSFILVVSLFSAQLCHFFQACDVHKIYLFSTPQPGLRIMYMVYALRIVVLSFLCTGA